MTQLTSLERLVVFLQPKDKTWLTTICRTWGRRDIGEVNL